MSNLCPLSPPGDNNRGGGNKNGGGFYGAWNPVGDDNDDDQDDDHNAIQEPERPRQDHNDSDYRATDSDASNHIAGSKSKRRTRKVTSKSTMCSRCTKIKFEWLNEVQSLEEKHREVELKLKREIKKLTEEIERLKGKNRVDCVPWTVGLDNFLGRTSRDSPTGTNNDNPTVIQNMPSYRDVYVDSCKQGNMSTNYKICHPRLYFDDTTYTPAQITAHFRDTTQPISLPFSQDAPFQFERLPVDIQYRIWKHLIPTCQLIHCLSRLDHRNPPLECTLGKLHFPSRFHLGTGLCCVSKADKPSKYLDYLLVSKRWHYVLAHLFYASNTFAFSSLGEFGRFCNGIGKSRVQRLVQVEIMWRGSLMNMQENARSNRLKALSWLMHTLRLRTLRIYINESGKTYLRRRRMMEKLGRNLPIDRTDLQPNCWRNRSLRTVQGMEFIYQLRGMMWVKFHDINAKSPHKHIYDDSFFQDVQNQVLRPKSRKLASESQIDNLSPLTGLEHFNPGQEVAKLVRGFYDDTSVDDLPAGGPGNSYSDSDDDSRDFKFKHDPGVDVVKIESDTDVDETGSNVDPDVESDGSIFVPADPFRFDVVSIESDTDDGESHPTGNYTSNNVDEGGSNVDRNLGSDGSVFFPADPFQFDNASDSEDHPPNCSVKRSGSRDSSPRRAPAKRQRWNNSSQLPEDGDFGTTGRRDAPIFLD